MSSRDVEGHFCGQDDETGELAPTPEGKVGFCGPDCRHCVGYEVYGLEEIDGRNVWVCVADSSYVEEGK